MKSRTIATICALATLAGTVGVAGMANVSSGEGSGTPWPEPTDDLKDLAVSLEDGVRDLAMNVGQRNVRRSGGMRTAIEWIGGWVESMGYEPSYIEWVTNGQNCATIEVTFEGSAAKDEVVVFATHYDSYRSSPSADATASGTVAMLRLLEEFHGASFARTTKFVFLPNGEPPLAGTEDSGAVRYAQRLEEAGANVAAVVEIGPIGYFSREEGSQSFFFPWSVFWPGTGDFVAITGNPGSRSLVERASSVWQANCSLPVVAGAAPSWLPGMQSGDHDAFNARGFDAVLISDTGKSRFVDIRTAYDQFHRLDYEGYARAVRDLKRFVPALVRDL